MSQPHCIDVNVTIPVNRGGMASQVSQKQKDKKSKMDVLKKHVKLLLHAQSCTSKEQGTCRVTECHEAKRVLRHIDSCRGNKSCTEKRCPIYLRILNHMQSCTESNCHLCHPFHNDVTSREGDKLVKKSVGSSDGDILPSREGDRNHMYQLPNSDTPHPLLQQPSMGDFQVQWAKIQEDVSHIQMTNRNILQKLNQSEREEKENRRIIRELNQNIEEFCTKLTQKDQMLDRLAETVLTLQQKLEQLVSLIQTNSIHMLHTPLEANESTVKVGAVSQGDMDDDDNDDDSDEEDDNVRRDRSGVFSNQLSVHNRHLTEDDGKSFASNNGDSGFYKEVQPTDDNDTYFSLSDISDLMSTGSPDEDTCKISGSNKQLSVGSVNNSIVSSANKMSSQEESVGISGSNKQLSVGSVNNSIVPSANKMSSQEESVGMYDVVPLERNDVNSASESSDSYSSLKDNNIYSQEKSIKSEANEHRQDGPRAKESVRYHLPPPMSTRNHQGQDGEETLQGLLVMHRDSKGLKRMRTSENSDNRMNSGTDNIVCGNTSNIKGRNWQDGCDKNIIVSHSANGSDGTASQLDSLNVRRRGSFDSSSQKSKGITDQNASSGIGSSHFDFSGMTSSGLLGEDYIDVDTWVYLANKETQKAKCEHRGKGPDTVLCLDISESMMGENFKTMMSVAKDFIRDIENVALTKGIQENISLTIFGHETRVLRHLTNKYQTLLSDLDGLTAGGNTPMTGGLLMALSGCLGNGGGTSIKSTTVHARIILLTDGKATTNGQLTSDVEAGLEDQIRIKAELCGVCENLRRRKHRVYWVPIGHDSCSIFTDHITTITKGKTIAATKPSELRRLIRWTQIRCFAVEIADQYPMKGTLEKSVLQNLAASHGITCNTDDLKDLVEECQESDDIDEDDALSASHTECNPYMPKIGSRVKRGSTWVWGNQDSSGVGTVIGHQKNGMLWVEWDNGHKNRYNYSPRQRDVEVTDSPRILKSFELIATGCLVKRGKSWTAGNDDGGPGCVGAVFCVRENGFIGVRWHCGNQGMYKFGSDGRFDVEVCHPSEVKDGRVTSGLTREVSPHAMPMNDSHPVNASKTLSVEEKNKRNTQKAAEPIARWQYSTDGNAWNDYPTEQNEKLEKAYKRNKQGSPIVDVDDTIFQVSFVKMMQTNPKTKETMKIQRIDLNTS